MTDTLPYTPDKRAAMRRIYAELKRAGQVGATRADLVSATGLSLWDVRTAATEMHRQRWIYAVQQMVQGRATWRYCAQPKYWRRS